MTRTSITTASPTGSAPSQFSSPRNCTAPESFARVPSCRALKTTRGNTALTAGGCGHFSGGKIICPFHGWRWDTRGRNEFVLEPQEFRGGKLADSDVALREVRHVVFAGFIFINLSPNPEPFDDFIAPVRQLMENLAIGEMHHYWWKSIPVPANWKVAQEAFFE